MNLTGKMIVDKGLLITNGKGKEAQVGYDVTVNNITKIRTGVIGLSKEDTKIQEYFDIALYGMQDGSNSKYWDLDSGVYSLTFDQGVKLDNKHCGYFVHRSSILRASGFITSGIFDNGFECNQAGATLFVMNSLTILKGARIAQFVCQETHQVANKDLYKGSYQGNKDLK